MINTMYILSRNISSTITKNRSQLKLLLSNYIFSTTINTAASDVNLRKVNTVQKTPGESMLTYGEIVQSTVDELDFDSLIVTDINS